MKNDKDEFPSIKEYHVPPRYKLKRGLGAKPLLEAEIRKAQSMSKSAAEAARNLSVSYNTYKKYAKMYGIFEDLKNPTGIGIKKNTQVASMHYPLDELLKGVHPKYPIWKLKKRILLSGYMEEKCSNCGFCERRMSDYRVPLVLDFLDGDRTNHKYENLRMLCFNCSFLINGNLTGPRKEYYY
jgi:5-methylcytosine-specific restriction endonuclease McrA